MHEQKHYTISTMCECCGINPPTTCSVGEIDHVGDLARPEFFCDACAKETYNLEPPKRYTQEEWDRHMRTN